MGAGIASGQFAENGNLMSEPFRPTKTSGDYSSGKKVNVPERDSLVELCFQFISRRRSRTAAFCCDIKTDNTASDMPTADDHDNHRDMLAANYRHAEAEVSELSQELKWCRGQSCRRTRGLASTQFPSGFAYPRFKRKRVLPFRVSVERESGQFGCGHRCKRW